MSGVVFTLLALVISIAGSLVVWLRHRKPTAFDQGIVDFRREMQALSPDVDRRRATTDSRREGTG